jgi:predicted nuclease of predicted toxin-antitoxin system
MRLLLDVHMPTALAGQLRRRGVDTESLATWLGGVYREAVDALVLAAARSEARVLVTFDCDTNPTLLIELADAGGHHAGVVLVSVYTYRQDDIGGLLRTLLQLVSEQGGEDWTDRVQYLKRVYPTRGE